MEIKDAPDRRGTNSLKWDDRYNEEGKSDVIPLWVADMDLATPDVVVEALSQRAAHPVYGYTNPPGDYRALLAAWYQSRYARPSAALVSCTGNSVNDLPGPGEDDILLGPGVVPSLGIAIRALTRPGSGVLVPSPVYYPFFDIVTDNERELVRSSLCIREDGHFALSVPAQEEALAAARERGVAVEALLLCSPHNPGGRIWSDEELAQLVSFAKRERIALIVDEIHADLALRGEALALRGKALAPANRPFVSLASLPADAELPLVVIGAPNKTFNIPGLHFSHFVVRDEATRARIARSIAATGYSQPNTMSIVAARAAYSGGGPWLDALIDFLRVQCAHTLRRLEDSGLGLRPVAPEAGYLVWVDARALLSRLSPLPGAPTDERTLVDRLAREARVRLTAGSIFGPEGAGYLRVNIACPRAQLDEGLDRFFSWAKDQLAKSSRSTVSAMVR